ncbi:MAG: DNA polymerase III subunit beta [Ruminococcus sp.]|nr:DNA polymerase III subunit beta [Ruminococcus sp.]
MKFICEKNALSEALINVSKAVADKSTLPSLEGVKFSLENGMLELTGYDLEFGIRTSIPVDSDDKGSFIANARIFSEMVRKMPNNSLTIEVNEGYLVTLSSGVTFFNLNAVSAEDYPELPKKDPQTEIKISQPVLKSMINQTKFAAAVTDMNPVLKGEKFIIENNLLKLVGLDGYRLGVRFEPISFNENIEFIVPARNLDEIAKLLSDDEDKTCSMFLSKKHIVFEINNYMINSRLMEGKFHDYRTSIPDEIVNEIIVEKSKLIDTLERCQLLINDKNPSPVRCVFGDGKISIKCTTSSLGKFEDEIEAQMNGITVEIGFKCRYFLEPLKVIPDEKVKLTLTNSIRPMQILPLSGDKYLYLVLPVRLNRGRSY